MDEPDFSNLRPLARTIEQVRIEQGEPPQLMGAYLLGVAVGYMQQSGISDDKIRETLEKVLGD